MNALDDLKKLLAAASPGPWQALTTKKRREATLWAAEGRYSIATFHDQGHSDPLACAQLAALARDLVQALVESQEALSEIGHGENTSYLACPGPPHCDKSHYPTCPVQIARDALRLAGLKEAMEQR